MIFSDDDTLVCEGSTVDFNIVANGFGAKTYQWQWLYTGNWIDLTDGGDISGVTTPNLRIQNAEAADSGYYRCFVTSGCGTAYSDSMNLDINLIVATIGTPAPFLIDSTTTEIRVGVIVTDRFLNWDLGFALVAPDGTEVMLKAPMPFWCILNPFNNGVDGTFTNTIDKSTGDTLDYCVNTKPLTGTFAATGNWNVLHGKDPANGAWQIRVYDADKSVPDPDGFIKLATLSFTDLDLNGDTAVINYNSGDINENVLNPISGELRPTSFVVPIRLMTSCFNSEDARAVVTVKGGIPPYTYQWTGPTTEPNSAQVDLGAGTYSVLVTDAMGCSSVATVEVSAPPAIVFDTVMISDTLACFGSTDGFIRAKASGGSGQMTYHLLPGNLTSSVADSGVFLNLAAGIYTLRATDPNGCSLDTRDYASAAHPTSGSDRYCSCSGHNTRQHNPHGIRRNCPLQVFNRQWRYFPGFRCIRQSGYRCIPCVCSGYKWLRIYAGCKSGRKCTSCECVQRGYFMLRRGRWKLPDHNRGWSCTLYPYRKLAYRSLYF